MDVESLAKQLILKGMTEEQQKAVLKSIRESVQKTRELQKQKVGENAQLVIQALKKIESDIRDRYDELGNKIESRVRSIKDGKDGKDGRNGANGRDGRDGATGPMGPRGKDGLNGRDGKDGVDGISVTDAHIDFDGSLIISLSNGRTINVGEVVAPDLTEKIKIIANGGGTSQVVLDTLASLQTQINNLIPSQTGQSGKFLTTNGTALAWAAVPGALNYKGTWDASTNTPALASSVGFAGDYYVVATAGSTNLNGITDWLIGDWLLFNGSVWQKIDQTNTVTSVNGQTGAVSLTTTNINEGTNLYYTDTRARAAVSAGTGISYNNTTGVITNSAPDQTVALTAGTGISTSGTYPNFTITNSDRGSSQNIFKNIAVSGQSTVVADGNDDTLTLASGTGISITTNATTDTVTITNSAPDQTVALTGAGTTSISGAYPNFTITSNDQYQGTVTSVAVSVPTGLSVSGSPITSSGTIAISLAAGYSIPTTTSQTNWDTAYTDRLKWDGGATGLNATTGRTSLGLGTIATQNANSVSISGGSITGITDLAVADGGTGASTALNARINLLPSYTGNGNKVLAVNGTTTDVEWVTAGVGTVTSVGQTFTGGLISVSGSPITTSGTLALTVAGTSGGIPYFSSGTTWASSSALASNALMVGGGAGNAPSTVTTGTGVVTALGVNTGTAGAFVVNGGALGTPSSGTVTNLTGTASININGTVGATTPNTGAFTSVTSTSASGILTRAAATQDGVALVGRAGGTSSFEVTLTPTTLSADRTLTLPDNSGTVLTTGATVTVAQGGTGATTLTANNVILGNGTSAVQFVAPGTNGNVLTSNGTTWTSAAAPAATTTISDDTSTNATRYLTFTSATSGTVSTLNVSSTKLTYNPSTGALSSTTVAGSSDERVKTNWRSLQTNFIEQLATVKSGIYDRTDMDAPVTQVGVTAQSLKSVLPNAVLEDVDGMLSVAYGNAALVSVIELAKRVIQQEEKINHLEAMLSKITSK